MLMQAVGSTNFNSYKKNPVSNSFARQNNYGVQMSDSVSFGNAESKAKETAFEVVKGIFNKLEGLKKNDLGQDAFINFAKKAVKELGENFDNIKQIKSETPVVEMGDGTHIKASNILGGYIFDHEPDFGKGLLNSIEIDASEKTAKISSYLSSGKTLIAKEKI